MKKKLTTLLAFVLVIALSIAGTYAYLTATSEVVENTFTVGDVKIKLDEAKVNLDGTVIEGADRVTANKYHLLPGRTYTKDPTVTVLKDSEDCYVRMMVTINEQDDLDKLFAPDGLPLSTFFGGVSTEWTLVKETENADDTRTYEFRYNHIVPKAAADTKLPALFTEVKIPGDLDNDEMETIKDLKITIVAHAMQAAGFEGDVDAAWDKF